MRLGTVRGLAGGPVAWALVAVLADAGMEIFGKLGAVAAMPWQSAFLRWSYGLLLLLPIFLVLRRRPRMGRLGAHLGRFLLNLGATYCYFAALKVLPMSLVVTLFFTEPLFTVLAARLLLGERITRLRLLGVLLGFLGVALAAGSTASVGGELWAVGLALLGAAGWALLRIVTKRLGAADATLDLMFWLALLTALAALPLAAGRWTPLTLDDHLSFLAVAAFGVAASFCWITALKLGEASLSAGMGYLALPLAYLAGFLVFGEVPGPLQLAGAGCVLAAVACVARSGRTKPSRVLTVTGAAVPPS